MTDRNSSEKLDTLITEVVKVFAAVTEVSKEVHSVNNRMTGLEAVLNGINGHGGIVEDLKNMGQKIHRQGNDLSKLQRYLDVLDNDHENVKRDVDENKEKIKTLFIENNNNKINSAGINSKMATIMTVISGAMAAIVGLAIKYLETT